MWMEESKILDTCYLAGLAASDGHLYKKEPTTAFLTNNRIFASNIQQLLKSYGKTWITVSPDRLAVCIYSREFQELLTKRFAIPLGDKSSSLVYPSWITDEQQRQFIAGYFDGDSAVHNNRPRISLTTKSEKMANGISSFLCTKAIAINGPYFIRGRGLYEIDIDGNNKIMRFMEIIPQRHIEKITILRRRYSDAVSQATNETHAICCKPSLAAHSYGTAGDKSEEGVGDGRSVCSESLWATRGMQWARQ